MNATGESRTRSVDGGARRGYLRELGIDIWVRRDRRHAARPDDVGHLRGEDAPAGKPESAAGDAPVFDIRGFRVGRVLALFDASLWPHRRFFLDVALAMNGWRGDRREEVRFEWPQPLSAGGGEEAAGRAFRAFVAAQSGDDGRILVVGKTVAGLIGEEPPGPVLAVDQVVHGADRRELWRRVRNLR
ncbi:MAG: hypothetical protein OXM56_08200 [Gammaproteobacteria bacterium]|nr:hypothetical protein [Gammaproteobacteria bacterium]